MINALILSLAPQFKLDPCLIAAIIEVETGGIPDRVRYEKLWGSFVTPEAYAKLSGQSVDTEQVLQAMSWGPMQVMGAVARQHGYQKNLTRLTDAYLGIYYGCKHLAWLSDRHSGQALISSYNAGSIHLVGNGEYSNQKYVDRVTHWVNYFKENGIHADEEIPHES